MEKLQKALEQARSLRNSGVPTPTGAHRPGPLGGMAAGRRVITGSAADALARWQALAPFTPDPKHMTRNRVITHTSGRDATPFDILRTKILLQMRANNWTRVAITSPTPSCGKTTTACNLALGLARQSETRSILFDMDLRRPGVGKSLGIRPDRGIRAIMEREAPFGEHAMRLGDNLAVCAARGAVPDPTSLLISETTSQILDEVQSDYRPDVMLFDLPPMLVTDDTRAFLRNVDCALILVRAGATRVNQIDECEKEISEHTNVLGVVLNQCRNTDESYGYDYY